MNVHELLSGNQTWQVENPMGVVLFMATPSINGGVFQLPLIEITLGSSTGATATPPWATANAKPKYTKITDHGGTLAFGGRS